jgi:hypothetical protein
MFQSEALVLDSRIPLVAYMRSKFSAGEFSASSSKPARMTVQPQRESFKNLQEITLAANAK